MSGRLDITFNPPADPAWQDAQPDEWAALVDGVLVGTFPMTQQTGSHLVPANYGDIYSVQTALVRAGAIGPISPATTVAQDTPPPLDQPGAPTVSLVLLAGGGAPPPPPSGGGGYDYLEAPYSMSMSENGAIYAADLSTTDANAGVDLGISVGGTPGDRSYSGGGVYTGNNGGLVEYQSAGSWNGGPAVRIRVPTSQPNGGDAAYCGFLSLWNPNSGPDPTMIHFAYAALYESDWLDANFYSGDTNNKFVIARNLDGVSERKMLFHKIDGDFGDIATAFGDTEATGFGPTFGTTANYNVEGTSNPFNVSPTIDGEDALYLADTADHAGTNHSGTPTLGPNETVWFCHEWKFDIPRHHRVYVWTQDGVISQYGSLYLDYSISGQTEPSTDGYWTGLEGLGWYYNDNGARLTNDGVVLSDVRIAKGRSAGSPIPPPAGFLT